MKRRTWIETEVNSEDAGEFVNGSAQNVFHTYEKAQEYVDNHGPTWEDFLKGARKEPSNET